MTPTSPAGELRTQVAQIGHGEYVVTAWDDGAPEDLRYLDAVLHDVARLNPAALLVDVRALAPLDYDTFDAVASALRELADAGVFVVLVADWRELGRALGAEGLDRFVAIRPTLASAIEAIRGRAA